MEPGVSVSRIALDNQLNANLLRRWIREAQPYGQTKTSPAFMPLAMPAASASASAAPGKDRPTDRHGHIRIEVPPRRWACCCGVADRAGPSMPGALARAAAMIRIDEIWLATEPLDMRTGPDKAWPTSSRCSVPPGLTARTCSPTAGATA
ncbi:hypothetical protein CEK62_09270 [Alcanivorax sp. N3-2A]|nr:hypothetical protein CEK62_09270 [Alcanivorax sp. N3-2A]